MGLYPFAADCRGIVAVLWSVLSFFSDTAAENKAEARRDSEYQEQGDLFHNGEDE